MTNNKPLSSDNAAISDEKSFSKKSEEIGSIRQNKGILKYRTQKEKDMSEFGSDYQIPQDEIPNEIKEPIHFQLQKAKPL